MALARLRDEAYNYQGLEMPYNTRRILIALMKETVKAQGELAQQHRYMAAFGQALSGRAYVVRTMLDELGLAEVPEAARRPAPTAGTTTSTTTRGPAGRRPPSSSSTPTSRASSRLTIVYEDFLEIDALEEAVEAGRLMGIDVTLGIECLVQTKAKTALLPRPPPRRAAGRPEELAPCSRRLRSRSSSSSSTATTPSTTGSTRSSSASSTRSPSRSSTRASRGPRAR